MEKLWKNCRKAADDERIEAEGKIRDAKNEALKRWVDKKDREDDKTTSTGTNTPSNDKSKATDSDKNKKDMAADKAASKGAGDK